MQPRPTEISNNDSSVKDQYITKTTTQDGLHRFDQSSSGNHSYGEASDAAADIDPETSAAALTKLDTEQPLDTPETLSSSRLKAVTSTAHESTSQSLLGENEHKESTEPSTQLHAYTLRILSQHDQAKSRPTELVDLPNEVLTHIFSHLPPQALNAVALVSQRFHAHITQPHAWRIAFARYFPGSAWDSRSATTTGDLDAAARRRHFTRLSTLASWRSEYMLRASLLRALGRGRPGEAIAGKSRSSNQMISQVEYSSGINLSISHIDAMLGNNPNHRSPKFVHGAEQVGTATVSEPSAGKSDGWGAAGDPFMLNEFVDLFPGEAQYGLGGGQVVGLPNSLAVSRRHGIICGEGIPGGRLYYRHIEEQRGRRLLRSLAQSDHKTGIPLVNVNVESLCSVWIARTANIPDLTEGLIGMLSGSSAGILTAYSLGATKPKTRKLERGEMTARWVLSPGVPIIAIAIDEHYSAKRSEKGRIWAVVLNALGEAFYVTELPRRAPIEESSHLSEDATYGLAWQTGRSIYWSLIEPTRRITQPDPYGTASFDGSYSPRGSSDSMGLSEDQIKAETKEIEQYIQMSPREFQRICEGWDMRRRLEVDFAGCNENKAGEAVVIFDCALEEDQRSRIRRFTRFKQKSSVTPLVSQSQSPALQPLSSSAKLQSLAMDSSWSFSSLDSRRDSTASSASSAVGIFETWRVSHFSFGSLRNPQVTTTAIDMSKFALLTMFEDPLLNMSASLEISPMSSPYGVPVSPIKQSSIPGQRARFVAVGTKMGSVLIWNIRAPTSKSSEIVNDIGPLRIIHTDSPQITSLALTALCVVHGGNDGLVQAWDSLASDVQPIRTINSRFSSRARRRIIQAEASPHGVGVNLFAAGAIWLDPDPKALRGMVSIGGQLRYWSYSSESANQHKSSKKRLRRMERGSNNAGERFGPSGRGAIHDYITRERIEMEKERSERQKEEELLTGRFGTDLLGPNATEDEIMAYATMLSEEAAQKDNSTRQMSLEHEASLKPRIGATIDASLQEDTQDGDDLAEAIQASLEETNNNPLEASSPSAGNAYTIRYARSRKSQTPIFPGSSTQPEVDDLDFALRLSLAEQESLEAAAEEDYYALDSDGTSSRGGKGTGVRKGKTRAM